MKANKERIEKHINELSVYLRHLGRVLPDLRTVMKIYRQVFPNGENVIRTNLVFTVDIRSSKEEHVLNIIEKVKALVAAYQNSGIQKEVKQNLYIRQRK